MLEEGRNYITKQLMLKCATILQTIFLELLSASQASQNTNIALKCSN